MALALDPERRYRYGDYRAWPQDERWELIDGLPYAMSPAPSIRHQTVSIRLAARIFELLRGKPCQVLTAPVDVLLPQNDEADELIDTVVQPDIVVINRIEIIKASHIRGAPDWIIEILSPATAKKDEGIKRDRYQQAGVGEYWMIHPTDKTLSRYVLKQGEYGRPDVFGEDDVIILAIPAGAELDLAEIFAD